MIPRLATPHDIPALVRLINAAYVVEQFFIHGDRTNAADLTAKMHAPGSTFLVLDTPGRVDLAGAVHLTIDGDHGHFAMLSVSPDQQKRGLGRILVEAVESHCVAAGCRALDLDVVDLREELPAFYRALGFAPSGTFPFPEPAKLRHPAHLVRMTKSLR